LQLDSFAVTDLSSTLLLKQSSRHGYILRLEVGPKIRVCSIEPGSVDSEPKYNATGTAGTMVLDLYAKTAIPAETIARAITYAMEQPPEVDINEIIMRRTAQEF